MKTPESVRYVARAARICRGLANNWHERGSGIGPLTANIVTSLIEILLEISTWPAVPSRVITSMGHAIGSLLSAFMDPEIVDAGVRGVALLEHTDEAAMRSANYDQAAKALEQAHELLEGYLRRR